MNLSRASIFDEARVINELFKQNSAVSLERTICLKSY